jgi:hypothetical protein
MYIYIYSFIIISGSEVHHCSQYPSAYHNGARTHARTHYQLSPSTLVCQPTWPLISILYNPEALVLFDKIVSAQDVCVRLFHHLLG